MLEGLGAALLFQILLFLRGTQVEVQVLLALLLATEIDLLLLQISQKRGRTVQLEHVDLELVFYLERFFWEVGQVGLGGRQVTPTLVSEVHLTLQQLSLFLLLQRQLSLQHLHLLLQTLYLGELFVHLLLALVQNVVSLLLDLVHP